MRVSLTNRRSIRTVLGIRHVRLAMKKPCLSFHGIGFTTVKFAHPPYRKGWDKWRGWVKNVGISIIEFELEMVTVCRSNQIPPLPVSFPMKALLPALFSFAVSSALIAQTCREVVPDASGGNRSDHRPPEDHRRQRASQHAGCIGPDYRHCSYRNPNGSIAGSASTQSAAGGCAQTTRQHQWKRKMPGRGFPAMPSEMSLLVIHLV